MKNRKGIDLDGRGDGEEIGRVEGRGNLIRIYLVRKELEKKSKKNQLHKKMHLKKRHNTHRKNSFFIGQDTVFNENSYGFLFLFYLRYRLCRKSRLASNSYSFFL